MKNLSQNENLEAMRHTAAHLLAAAVKDLWPGTYNAIGPAIEDGFYQDFDFGERKISEEDLPKIEKRMREILNAWGTFAERSVSADEARTLFADNPYKLELIEDFAQEGKNITVNDPGNFLDLCKGGHSQDPKKELKHFKLLSLAGAYWRGDEKKAMLTRVYGTAFSSKKELEDFLAMKEEAKKRDHRKLGKELGLFVFSDLVGAGLPLFTAKGTVIKEQLQNFVRAEKEKRGHQFVTIPHIAKAELYKTSGHLGKYDAMMPIMVDKDGNEYVVKAMSCPHHFEIFNAIPRSYRDLPLRLAETTAVYRNEKSGELSGLVRVISITQDDAHNFVRHDQIASEIEMMIGLMKDIYGVFGFQEYKVHISVRDPKHPEKYFGDDEVWQKAEAILIESVKKWGVPYVVEEGEAAFYGPKIDVKVKDAIGRTWQLTTIQLDFVQPENFHMRYVGQDGKEYAPAALHVAILGSVERFMGILLEHYNGALPLWLSPVQAAILPISDEQNDYAQTVAEELKKVGIRVEIDSRSESIGKKIREAQMQKVPYMLVVGKKEVEAGTVAVRSREAGDKGTQSTTQVIQALQEQLAARA